MREVRQPGPAPCHLPFDLPRAGDDGASLPEQSPWACAPEPGGVSSWTTPSKPTANRWSDGHPGPQPNFTADVLCQPAVAPPAITQEAPVLGFSRMISPLPFAAR